MLAAGYSQGFDVDSVGPKREWHESELDTVDSMTLATYPVPQLLRQPSGGVAQHAEKYERESANESGSDPGVDGAADHEAPGPAPRAWSKEMLRGSWGSSANIPMNDTTYNYQASSVFSTDDEGDIYIWRTGISQRSSPSMEQWRPVMGLFPAQRRVTMKRRMTKEMIMRRRAITAVVLMTRRVPIMDFRLLLVMSFGD